MSSIILGSSESPLATFYGSTNISASLQKEIRLSATIQGRTELSRDITGGTEIIQISGSTQVSANLSITRNLSATVQGSTQVSAELLITVNDPLNLALMITTLPELVSATKLWLPRLKVNGVEVQIEQGNISSPEDQSGWTLQCIVANPRDKNLFSLGAQIDFGIGRQSSYGVWDESSFVTLIQNGTLIGVNNSLGTSGQQLTDRLQIAARSDGAAKLQLTPERPLIIYNSLLTEVDTSNLDILYDTNGEAYPTEALGVAGLTIYDLFQEIFVDRCGFSGYKTNIPNFEITRVDCPIGQPFLESISGYIGMINPAIIELDDIVWIIDTTIALPAGFPAPIGITVEDYQTLSTNEERADLDGVILTYIENSRGYDFVTTDFETDLTEYGDSGDPEYVRIFTQRGFREYRKFSRPGVVLKRELYQETITTSGFFGGTVEEVRETRNFDSQNRITSRTKEVRSAEPDLDNPGATFTFLTSSEDENWSYNTHPFQPRRQYLARKELKRRGLIMVDSENQQLGVDFKQEYKVSSRSGNLREGQTTEFDNIDLEVLTWRPLRNGLVRTTEFKYNYLNKQVERDGVPEDVPGDVAINAIGPEPREMIVLKDDSVLRSGRPLGNFHGGEMPVTYLIPLVRRMILAQAEQNRQIQTAYIGFNQALHKGLPVTFNGRNEVIGTFLLTGIDIAFNRSGTQMLLTGRELNEIAEFVFGDENPVGAYALILTSNEVKTFDLSIFCKNGYSLSCTAVPGIAVEAKRTADVSWTDIEGSSYDLSPYDQTFQDFQIRLTAGVFTAKGTVQILITAEAD